MSRYVDGYVLPLPENKLEDYKKMAEKGGKIWMEHGALQYVEAVGEDLKGNEWCAPFTTMVKLNEGETIIFAFIIFNSREHRDEVNKKVMEDPRMSPENMGNEMPFDMKRMAFSGFETLVDL